MGGSSTKNNNVIDAGWQLVSRGQEYNLFRDQNGRHGQEYNYILDNRYSPSDEFDIYSQRKTATQPIVRVYAAENKVGGTTLIPQNNMRVITESMKNRLSTAPQLTYPQSLYILDKSLHGYSLLYDKVGPFNVNGDMIGFTEEGETRVWLNENLAKNHPSHQKNILQSTVRDQSYLSTTGSKNHVNSDESQMVRNIVNVVEDKCEKGVFPEPFKSKIQGKQVGFREARDIVHQTISEERHVPINSVDLIKNMIKIRSWGAGKNQDHHYISHDELKQNQGNFNDFHFVPRPEPLVYPQHIINPPTIQSQPTYYNTYNTYQPMPSAKTTTNLKFNYIQPKEYFHPDMFARRY